MRLQFRIEGMKECVVNAVQHVLTQEQEQLDVIAEATVKKMDLAAVVQNATREYTREYLRRAIENAVGGFFNSYGAGGMLNEIVRASVATYFKGMVEKESPSVLTKMLQDLYDKLEKDLVKVREADVKDDARDSAICRLLYQLEDSTRQQGIELRS